MNCQLDAKVSILFSLLLARTSILSCFFSYFTQYFLIIPVVKDKIKVKLALVFPTGAPITVVKRKMNTPPLVPDKTIKILSMLSNAATYLLNFILFNFLCLISWLKYF